MLYYMYDIMLYIYYTVLNLLPPITYPPFPKREIYQFTDLPFYHPEKPSDLREVYRKCMGGLQTPPPVPIPLCTSGLQERDGRR